MRVGKPIGHGTSQTGEKAYPGANSGAAKRKPPIAETILDPLPKTPAELLGLGYAGFSARQVDALRDPEETQRNDH